MRVSDTHEFRLLLYERKIIKQKYNINNQVEKKS